MVGSAWARVVPDYFSAVVYWNDTIATTITALFGVVTNSLPLFNMAFLNSWEIVLNQAALLVWDLITVGT